MSEPLSPADEEEYTKIIDTILKNADLETVTMKKIRSGLEAALDGKDLSDHKAAIKALIGARFDIANTTAPQEASDTAHSSPKRDHDEMTNGHIKSEDEDADSSGDQNNITLPMPPKKKQKRESSTDDDAKYARKLQREEEQMARQRKTRGGGTDSRAKKGAAAKKKTPKKKSKAKVGADDDSDVDGGGEPTKRKAGGGFQKPFNLSHQLADVCGAEQLSRPQVVKKLWEHIKGNDLQDPNDKRQILCDEKMQAVFKQSKVDMFQMNKLIGNHLYPVEEEA